MTPRPSPARPRAAKAPVRQAARVSVPPPAASRRTIAFVSLGSALAGLALFASPLTQRAAFFYRDVPRQYEPIQHQVGRALSLGELPLWNSSTQSGVPLLANVHAGALYPLNLAHLALTPATAYAWLVWAHWVWLVLGTFVLLRGLVRTTPAVLAAAALGLSGIALSATTYLPYLEATSWLPWILLALRRRGEREVVSPAMAVMFALQVVAGDPSVALMTALACAAWGWAEAPSARAAARALLVVTLSGLAALGLAAPQLVPAVELYRDSVRATSELGARLAWSFEPTRAFEWIARLPFGALLAPPFFPPWSHGMGQDAQPFFLDHGWGPLVLLGLVPGLSRPGPLLRAGLVLIAIGVALSLGQFGGPLGSLHAAPPFVFFRFPERYGLLVTLGAVAIAARGLVAVLEGEWRPGDVALTWLGVGGILLLAGLVAPRGEALATAALRAGAIPVLAAGAWWLARGRRPLALAAIALLCAAEGAIAARADLLVLPVGDLRADPAYHEMVLASGARVWRDNATFRAQHAPVRGAADFAREQRMLVSTYASALPGTRGIDETGGYGPVSLLRWATVMAAVPRPLTWRLFDTGWVVTTNEAAVRWGLAKAGPIDDHAALFRTGRNAGRAWLVKRVVDVPGMADALAAMNRPDFDPSELALRDFGSATPPAPGAATSASVRVAPRTSSNRIALRIEDATSDAYVVVSEVWCPGWRSFADGKSAPVERVNGTLMGVRVPRGTTDVELRYVPPGFVPGLAVSLGCALALVAVGVRRRGIQLAAATGRSAPSS
ncbi:MAG: YfhO family protein [Candidatus Eisenbacteria bacterium]|nr:YfhO family protein [Candidatus Eisenbacteria bacterium]